MLRLSQLELRWRDITVSRISFALLIATSLVLTTYFGLAAWRLSKESETDVTGEISPRPRTDASSDRRLIHWNKH